MRMSTISFLLSIYTSYTYAAEQFLWSPLESLTLTCDFCCYRNNRGKCHGAIDYRARIPQSVFAAADGTVEKVVNGYPDQPIKKWAYGNQVQIRHPNGYLTLYAHLTRDSITVAEGESVNAGQQIALSDNSGFSTGPHLHFEVRNPQGRKVNPYGDPPNYVGGCGLNPLWATCPPQAYAADRANRDDDRDGWTIATGDCNDNNRTIYPNASESCNNRDDDCDGMTDERWRGIGPLALGAPCSVGLGVCTRNGQVVCTFDGRATVCDATAGTPGEEIPQNQLDDDCDGCTDEGPWLCPEGMILPEGYNFCVDLFEASDGGNGLARSVVGVLPWVSITFSEAQAACGRAGKHLCDENERSIASCGGSMNHHTYPYGNTFNSTICNGRERETYQLLPTGSLESCRSLSSGAFDMAGNADEWIDKTLFFDRIGYQSVIAGGSFLRETRSVCDSWPYVPQNENRPDRGFRCCLDACP